MREIYSSEPIRIDGVSVLGISCLSETMQRWVKENRKRLLAETTLPERVAANMLSKRVEKPVRQAYFMIRGRSYYLDFFLPSIMTAIEIDGSVHNLKKKNDRRRDADFRSIGIRTIRIKNKDVMNGHFFDVLFKKLYKQK